MQKRAKVLNPICLLLLLSVTVLSAKKIDVWLVQSNEEMKIIRDLTSDFTKKTGIEVIYTYVNSADSETVFLMAAASNTPYDVGSVGLLFAPELGLRGGVRDLSSFADFNKVAARFHPKYFNSLQYLNLTFGIPYRSYIYLGYQCTDILNEMGIDTLRTWEELKKVLPRLQAKKKNAALTFGLGEGVYADVNMFMWQHGGEDYNSDLTQSGYDSFEAIAGFKEFVELYTKHGLAKEVVAFQAFLNGDIPILLQSGHFCSTLELSAPQITGPWQMTPALGTIKNGKLNIDTFIGGLALTISKDSKDPTSAWEYIKWITSSQTQAEISKRFLDQIKGTVFIPANLDAISQMSLKEENTKTLKLQAEGSRSSTYGLVAPRLRRRYLQFAAQEAVLMGKDPEGAMRKAASEHNEEIKKKNNEYKRFIEKLLAEAKKKPN